MKRILEYFVSISLIKFIRLDRFAFEVGIFRSIRLFGFWFINPVDTFIRRIIFTFWYIAINQIDVTGTGIFSHKAIVTIIMYKSKINKSILIFLKSFEIINQCQNCLSRRRPTSCLTYELKYYETFIWMWLIFHIASSIFFPKMESGSLNCAEDLF